MTQDTPEQTMGEEDDHTTTSTQTRWEGTATVVAILTLLSVPSIIALAALGVLSLDNIDQAWFLVYSTIVLMAATWTFGKETLEAVKKARGQ